MFEKKIHLKMQFYVDKKLFFSLNLNVCERLGGSMMSIHRGGNNHSPTRQMQVEFGIGE
jgi:hypothetical protein